MLLGSLSFLFLLPFLSFLLLFSFLITIVIERPVAFLMRGMVVRIAAEDPHQNLSLQRPPLILTTSSATGLKDETKDAADPHTILIADAVRVVDRQDYSIQ
jgi:hypothetical protein